VKSTPPEGDTTNKNEKKMIMNRTMGGAGFPLTVR
jgi:hypothetical protein